ncbi:MAG TPA: hypothetical protein VMP13_07080 [Acidimicrobiia bacterium]|nr:hypothetical protein [Acidimicrobiia bacterium]
MHDEDRSGLRLMGSSDLAGHGDGMQVIRQGTNDVFVDEDLNIFITDRLSGGIYVLEPHDALADQMARRALKEHP